MEDEKARDEQSAMLRTEELQAELKERKKDVLDREQAVEDRADAKLELQEAADSLKTESSARLVAESEFRRMFDATPDMMALGGFDGFYKRVNPAMLKTLGYSEQEMLHTSLHDLMHPDDVEALHGQVAKLVKGEKGRNLYYRVRHKDGHYLHTEWTDVPLVDGGVFFTMGRDITARIELEESLRLALASMSSAERMAKVGSWELDLVTGTGPWSDQAYRVVGLTPGEVTPSLEEIFALTHPDDIAMVRDAIEAPLASGDQRQIEFRLIWKDGSVHDIVARMEMTYSPDGSPTRLRGTCQDVSDQRDAERHQHKLEEQLRVSQKMEAVGSLAAGIAHDFNNLLSVILSYVGFVMEAVPAPDPRRDDLMEVQKAAERAALLTRQLLAFSRKQVLRPVLLNLNKVAADMQQMLRRLIKEDISLVFRPEPELGLTLADPGQIEQVIMNLVVNARDAMPGTGRLTIETANVEIDEGQATGLKEGPHVMISVADTGTGMDVRTRERVFEPFFTTKEVGKGTGLGLPTVYGIVKQTGGHIAVYSEPGVGTVFRIYLPRDTSGMPVPASAPPEKQVSVTGSETILIVEDEVAVRNGASRILGACGYTVLTATNGQEALRVCDSRAGEISLVLTDVIMPNMSGGILAQEIETRWPATRILFMSGYSGDAILGDAVPGPGAYFIGKPFNAKELALKVRSVLDADEGASAIEHDEVSQRQAGGRCE